ncbi:acyltransferase family protein [Aquisalinus flavus]|uniref:O-antigen acetylase n=1 Tax=Aquisalinus flavus TaxID=1526572 RepID=A0A8J2V310_9PROT|nr:acyltransferase family protein [Aquisalinus flavus]MBD0426206.1 acyltransferase [Aquisalinus flavus]GGD09754.1 O-antigen acetylase [Aquisalinus flavus]
MKGSDTLDYRPDIDGLRALAVVLVVLFHAGVSPLSGGFIGVDVFFVISGYLITRLIMKERAEGKFSFGRFYLRRIKRLAPALFFTILVTLAVGWFLFPPTGYELLAESAAYAVISISNFLFWEQAGYFDVGADIKPLLHTWSLSVEEQFYLLWPLTLVLLMRVKWRHAVPAFLVLAAIASVGGTEAALRDDPDAAFYLLPYRVMELAAGALVNFLPPLTGKGQEAPAQTGTPRWRGEAMAGAGLLLILIPAFALTGDTPFPGINAIPPVLGTALLIYAGAGTLVARGFSVRPVVYVGLISYSLYLAHWPIIVFYGYRQGGALSLVEQGAVIAASFAVAAAMYHLIEQPFRGRSPVIRLPRLPGWGVGLAAGAGALACIAASAIVYFGKGLPGRFDASPEVATLLASMRDGLPAEVAAAQEALPPDAPKIVVAGDSHTVPMWMALSEWGAAHGVRVERVELGGGCPALYRAYVFGDPTQSGPCNSTKDRKLEDLANGGYDAIVLSTRWGLYTSEVTDADPFVATRPRSLALDPQAEYDPDGDAISRTAFKAGLRQTVDLFARTGTAVIFVGQAPPVGGRLEQCVALEVTLAGINANCRKASHADILRETQWATHAAQQVEAENLYVVDALPLFCEERDCSLIRDGRSLFYDDNHLSIWGGRVMLSGMTDYLEQITGR